MRKALIIGINDYENFNPLNGCVEDASQVANILATHSDGTRNFEVNLLTQKEALTKKNITKSLKKLFDDNEDVEVALFYFSGHGHRDNTGHYLVTYDGQDENFGIDTKFINNIISQSKAQHKIVILDCCFAGGFADIVNSEGVSKISEITKNTTILSASRASEVSIEDFIPYTNTISGIFTSLFIEALNGGSADILGNITPANIYYYIDKGLGAWDQRPIFKTHTSKFVFVRKVKPKISLSDLKKITNYFETPQTEFKLDPSFEFTHKKANPKNVEIFKILQKFKDNGLIIPNGEEYMYFAAINSKTCNLTALGFQYWKLVKQRKI